MARNPRQWAPALARRRLRHPRLHPCRGEPGHHVDVSFDHHPPVDHTGRPALDPGGGGRVGAQVGNYALVEVTVDLDAAYGNPFDQREVALDAVQG